MKLHRVRKIALTFTGVLVASIVLTRPAVYVWLADASLRAIEEVNELRTHTTDRCIVIYPCPNDI